MEATRQSLRTVIAPFRVSSLRTKLVVVFCASVLLGVGVALRRLYSSRRTRNKKARRHKSESKSAASTGSKDRRTRSSFRTSSKRTLAAPSSVAEETASAVPASANVLNSSLDSGSAFVYSGYENVMEASRMFEAALRYAETAEDTGGNMEKRITSIINQNAQLQRSLEEFFHDYPVNDRTSMLSSSFGIGCSFSTPESSTDIFFACKTFSVLSDDSFLSALDDIVPPVHDLAIEMREPLKINAADLRMYHMAMKAVSFGTVSCRIIRTDAMNCDTDEEFLAKVFCIRKAANLLFGDAVKRNWIRNLGRELVSSLLISAGKDPATFQEAYDRLMDYVEDAANWDNIENELKGRRIQELNFYDVLMDFVLMDAFDDLAHPPASVLAVAQNRFFSASFKESTRDGFLSRYYDVCEHVSPTLAWGFLGTDERLHELFYYFKDQVYSFLVDIFSFEKVRYTSVKDLSEDIWDNFKYRVDMTRNKMMDDDIVVE